MKKLLALLITLILALGMLAACGDDPCEVHTDGNSDGICDVCEEKLTTDGESGGENAGTNQTPPCTEHVDLDKDFTCDTCDTALPNPGLDFSNAIIASLEEAGSFKAELSLTVSNGQNSFGADGAISEPPITDREEATLFLTVSRASDGGFNLALDVAADNYSIDREGLESSYELPKSPSLYIVDGVLYRYDGDTEGFVITEPDVPEELSKMIAFALTAYGELSELSITEEEINAILTALGEAAITTFNIKDNYGSISVSLADEANRLIGYIKELDPETATVGDVLDDLFTLAGAELTAEELFAEIAAAAGLTVNEAIGKIDAALTEKYGTTLQGIYDDVIADEGFKAILKAAFILDSATKEEADEAFNAAYTELSALKLSDLITEQELGDRMLYELVSVYLMGMTPEELPTYEEAAAATEAFPEASLDAMLPSLGLPPLTELQQQLGTVVFNALDARLDLDFTGFFNLATVNGEFNLDLSATNVFENGSSEVTELKVNGKLAIYDIKKEATEISLDGYPIYQDLLYTRFKNDTTEENDRLYTLYMYENGDKIYFEFSHTRRNRTVTFAVEPQPLSVLASKVVTIPTSALSATFMGEVLTLPTEGAYVFSLDPVTESITILSEPEFLFPVSTEVIISEIKFNGGTTDGQYRLDAEKHLARLENNPDSGGINDQKDILYLDGSYSVESITFTYTERSDGSVDCTIVGFNTGGATVLDPVTGEERQGYITDNLDAYFGGSLTFRLWITIDDLLTADSVPDILAAYIKQ